jgi:hypothetical protein
MRERGDKGKLDNYQNRQRINRTVWDWSYHYHAWKSRKEELKGK